MHYYLCSVNDYSLISYEKDGAVLKLQDMRRDYEAHTAVRFSNFDKEGRATARLWMHVRIDARDFCMECPADVVGLLFDSPDDTDFATATLKPGVKALDTQWARRDGPHTGIEAFLRFFPEGSVLSYDGEFGADMACFVPFVKYLHDAGHLRSRKIATHSGMESYFFWLSTDQMIKRKRARFAIDPKYRFPTPNSYEGSARATPFNTAVDYRSAFRNSDSLSMLVGHEIFDIKPTIFIQNKFTVEWMEGPINYFPLILMHAMFNTFREKYNFIYSRPGMKISDGYSVDENNFCTYPDRDLMERFEVPCLELMSGPYSYNEQKLRICAHVDKYITVQGGGSYVFSMFPESEIHLLHKTGPELDDGSYSDEGFFTFLNGGSNRTLVYRNKEELWAGLNAAL